MTAHRTNTHEGTARNRIGNTTVYRYNEKLKNNQRTDEQKELQKLNRVAKRATRVLFQARTAYPFDLFPDEIVIDENQVNVSHRRFFYTQDIDSVLISQIKDVTVSTSIVFCSLTIQLLLPSSQPLKLDFLWPQDAHEARRLIQGLMAIQKEDIELSKIETKVLKDRLRDIGRESA